MNGYEVVLVVFGLAALAAAWLPTFTERRPLSLPLVLVALGALVALVPLGLPASDPRGTHLPFTERVTELAVIVSLMGAGLKIDRPFRWRTWSNTWRMLGIAMPITIAATAVAGAVVGGLGAASALLLGAVLAPTDPVLASDVQVGEPTLDERPTPDAEDEVRFTLTSEAGLNDALAFPFVYLAILAAGSGRDASDVVTWVAWDLIGRVLIGLAVGWAVGRLLAVIAFRPPRPLRALADRQQGFVAVAATLLAYGVAELCHGYGFLAVFVAAVVLRNTEHSHEYLGQLHEFAEQLENLLVVGLLLLFGAALVSGVLDDLTWSAAIVVVLLVLVVRPLAGRAALIGVRITATERWAIAFFGIRGFGSVYYLAFALGYTSFTHTGELWSIVALTMLCSIVIHGIAATPAMNLVDRAAGARRRRRGKRPTRSAPASEGSGGGGP